MGLLTVESVPLRTSLKVIYTAKTGKSADISTDVAADLLSLSYTDKVGDEADSLSLQFQDASAKWALAWDPERGDTVAVTIGTKDGRSVTTGKMMIDRLSISGRPRTFTIEAVNIPLDNTVRRTQKERAFESTTLKAIGDRIAADNGLEFSYTAEDDPEFDRVSQNKETDLEFLARISKDYAITVKIFDGKLVMYDQKALEASEAKATLTESGSTVLSWSFETQQDQRYKAVTVQWRNVRHTSATRNSASEASSEDTKDYVAQYYGKSSGKGSAKAEPKKGAVKTTVEYTDYTYIDDSIDDSAQVFVMKKRVNSKAQAEQIAKAKLRELNLHAVTGNISVIGDPTLTAGSVIELSGFGSFDGRFLIESATHSVGGSGYTTGLNVRKCQEKY